MKRWILPVMAATAALALFSATAYGQEPTPTVEDGDTPTVEATATAGATESPTAEATRSVAEPTDEPGDLIAPAPGETEPSLIAPSTGSGPSSGSTSSIWLVGALVALGAAALALTALRHADRPR